MMMCLTHLEKEEEQTEEEEEEKSEMLRILVTEVEVSIAWGKR